MEVQEEARTVALSHGLFDDGGEVVNPGLTFLGKENVVALGDGDQCHHRWFTYQYLFILDSFCSET
jgi:hypothetical protein